MVDVQNLMERNFHQNRRRAYKKISKEVRYGDKVFTSGRALAKHLKLNDLDRIYRFIKAGEYKGVKLGYIK